MAPRDARLFDGRKEIEVQGELAPLDSEFLELRKASAISPDGRRIAVQPRR